MWNKNYLYFVLAAVAIMAVVLVRRGYEPGDSLDLSSNSTSTPTPILTASTTPSPVNKSTPKTSVKPTPALIFKVSKTYEQLTEEFEKEGRWMALNDSCTEIVPSNVTYHNNAEIMLDNTASTVRHILKIGGREYLLEAGEWFLTTLSSPTVPATLSIYCGSMELGSIDLVM